MGLARRAAASFGIAVATTCYGAQAGQLTKAVEPKATRSYYGATWPVAGKPNTHPHAEFCA